MAITDLLVLPTDVILVPVEKLPAEVRDQIEHNAGDYAITRPLSRPPSKIIDAHATALLEEFRTPKTIVDAVINFSRTRQLNPEQTLDDAYPLIRHLLTTRLLVPAGSDEAQPIQPSFRPGDRVGRFEVVRCVQVLEDTELYEARGDTGESAALKIRRGSAPAEDGTFETEAAILGHLDGRVNPALLDDGAVGDRRYMAIAWIPGTEAAIAAEDLRRLEGAEARRGLIDLCGTILDAYAHLHAHGVIHGDIHPRNVLVLSDESVKIIDYGLARLTDTRGEPATAHRGGVAYFLEPERLLPRRGAPVPTALGEQYGLAAMVDYLLTGTLYLEFSPEQDEMGRQILEETALPFSRRGVPPWPEVEGVIARAMSKDPADRFPSVAEFANQLRNAASSAEAREMAVPSVPRHAASGPETLLEEVLQRLGFDGSLLPAPLTDGPAVNTGAAGIAYGLYRIAEVRGDAAVLSLADAWSTKAVHAGADPAAFYNPEMGATAEVIGPVSLYHTMSGVQCVQGLISHAMGDHVSQRDAIDGFIRASRAPSDCLDLTLGKSGTLLGCALLLEAMPDTPVLDRPSLVDFGHQVMRDIWDQLDVFAPVRECAELPFLGVAHGWAGILYATLRWCQVAQAQLPAAVHGRLAQLAQCAEPAGQGLRWKRVLARQEGSPAWGDYVPSWCNGSGGFVFLWTLAHAVLRGDTYRVLAERAARHAWEDPDRYGDLCCGCAGRAYALLELYKSSGEQEWLRGARELAAHAAATIRRRRLVRDGLYKGEVGVAVLAADLTAPETACMPVFGHEGWPSFVGHAHRIPRGAAPDPRAEARAIA